MLNFNRHSQSQNQCASEGYNVGLFLPLSYVVVNCVFE